MHILYEVDMNGENRRIVATLEGVEQTRQIIIEDDYVTGGYYNRAEINEDGQVINDNMPVAGVCLILIRFRTFGRKWLI